MRRCCCVCLYLLWFAPSLLALGVFLVLLWPVPRDAFIAAHGGECVYTGNGTAACTALATGETKPVTVRNAPLAQLVTGATYTGAACVPGGRGYGSDYDPATALPLYEVLAMFAMGFAGCTPDSDAGRWVLLWLGKPDGAPADVPGTFTPNGGRVMDTARVVVLGVAVFLALMGAIFGGLVGCPGYSARRRVHAHTRGTCAHACAPV